MNMHQIALRCTRALKLDTVDVALLQLSSVQVTTWTWA